MKTLSLDQIEFLYERIDAANEFLEVLDPTQSYPQEDVAEASIKLGVIFDCLGVIAGAYCLPEKLEREIQDLINRGRGVICSPN